MDWLAFIGSILGGLIAGLITATFYCRKYKYKVFKMLDIIVVGLILGQAIGRWGNFFNQEAYGPITTLAHLNKIGVPDFITEGMFIDGAYRVPTFLYESILSLTGFIMLLMIRRYKYLKVGYLSGLYLIWYSIGRFFIEGMRTDSLMLGNIKVAQLVSIICIISGILIIFLSSKGTRFDNLYNEKEKVTI